MLIILILILWITMALVTEAGLDVETNIQPRTRALIAIFLPFTAIILIAKLIFIDALRGLYNALVKNSDF